MGITRRNAVAAAITGGLPFVVGSGMAAALENAKFVYANNSPYDSIDPHTVYDFGRAAPRLNLYDGLYRWVENPPRLIPWLAESHTVSADVRTYSFTLRPDARFHDGTPVTATDVVYSIERILALKKGPASLYADVLKPNSTLAPDTRTVVFNLDRPSAIFLATIPDILVVNSALVRKNETGGDWGEAWLARNEAGSGSYALQRYDPATGFTARRFTGHFAGWNARPYDEIEFRTVLETNTRVLGLIRGDFQAVDGFLPYDQIQRLRQAPNVQIIEQESMRVFMLGLNNRRPPMNDVHFRRALAYAFDYEGFIRDIMKGSVSRNPGPIPITLWGSPPGMKGYRYDLAKAREELAKVSNPQRSININALAGFSESEQAAVLFQSSLRLIGIAASVEVLPWSVIATRMNNPVTQADVIPLWRSTYYVDPNNWIGELFGRRYHGTRTMTYYDNPEFERKLDRALKSNDQAERQVIYEQMTQMITDDAASIFVYNTRWNGPYSKEIAGVGFSPVNGGQEMRWVTRR